MSSNTKSHLKVARLPNGEPEIFRTLQGEGPSMGLPATFLRLSLCNLHCIWCDTPYTWNWENTPWPHQEGKKYRKEDQILELSIEQIGQKLSKFATNRLVITGGEPLLQQTGLEQLFYNLGSAFPFIEIETNGTQLPAEELANFVTQFNVSPKLSNSGQKAELRLVAESLQFFALSPLANFKFVVSSADDLSEILEIKEKFQIPAEKIALMPEGISADELQSKRLWLAEKCLEHSFRLTDRLHVHLWGHTRGT